jgi:hypothetical protein
MCQLMHIKQRRGGGRRCFAKSQQPSTLPISAAHDTPYVLGALTRIRHQQMLPSFIQISPIADDQKRHFFEITKRTGPSRFVSKWHSTALFSRQAVILA